MIDPTQNDDFLNDFLTPNEENAASEELRESIFAHTKPTLRYRRWKRRTIRVGGFIACVSLCVFAYLQWTAKDKVPAMVRVNPSPSIDTPMVVKKAQKPTTALEMEWQALEAEENRAVTYKQAGDRYFDEEGDPLSALRCYTQALNNQKSLTVSAKDSWMLLALKHAREEEAQE